MMKIVLVSCVGKKADEPQPAKDLYQSPWFRLARQYAEKVGDAWYILSAKYGRVHPDWEIDPYDHTLNTMTVADRKNWAEETYASISSAFFQRDFSPDQFEVVILAGERYREFLIPRFEDDGYKVSVPMEGLGIGQQLAWLKKEVNNRDSTK